MYEEFDTTDVWSGEEIHCRWKSTMVAIATRHADAVDFRFDVNGRAVWIALPKGARTPAITSPNLRIVRLTEPSLTVGIEEYMVEGVSVRVYSAAKTVADCFKFRNKIGIDVSVEALKDCLRQKKATVNEIYRYAKICRVSNVIRPYMEAL